MAKKKSEGKSKEMKKDNNISPALSHALGIVTQEENRQVTGGVELKTFAERWIYDSNIIRFGELYMFAGEPASGKSQFMVNTAANFVKAGGYAVIIDTEHKSNAAATIIPNIGEKIYFSDRFGFRTAGTIDMVKAVKAGDEAAMEEYLNAWQTMLKDIVRAIKADPRLRDIPVFIGVDSLLGASSSISRTNYEEGGGEDGRGTSALARARSITEFLSNFSTDISGTKITVAFVNHGKESINMGGSGFGGPKIAIPGGDAPKFHCSTILYFRRGTKVTKTTLGGRGVHIDTYKSSFGDDQRSLTVTFYYDILRDENDEVVRDINGNPRRRIFWDWDESTAQILRKCIAGKTWEKVGAVKKVFPGLDMAGGKVSCKTFGFDKLSFTDFGKEIIANPDLYQKIMEIPRLSIHHAPPELVYKPDWSEDIPQSVGEGNWEVDGEAEREEADV